jgi:hypothetical protein
LARNEHIQKLQKRLDICQVFCYTKNINKEGYKNMGWEDLFKPKPKPVKGDGGKIVNDDTKKIDDIPDEKPPKVWPF